MVEDSSEGAAKVKVNKKQLSKAIKALTEVVAKRSANANPLFGSNTETIQVQITLSRIPEKAHTRMSKPVLIPIPHPLYNDSSDVCLIVKDPQKRYKELLSEHPVSGVGSVKVIGVTKLKKNYRTLDAKRTLADAYDLFLCDKRVIEMMPTVLGTVFYQKKNKAPIPVKLDPKDPPKRILEAVRATTLRVPGSNTLGVRIGRCGMELEDLLANAVEVIKAVTRHFSPQNPLQSISVQATDTMALPVWRREQPADPVNLKVRAAGASSSEASDTGSSFAPSDTEKSASVAASDTEKSASVASEASDDDSDEEDDKPATREELPLVRGLQKKRKPDAPPAAPQAKRPKA